MKLFTPSHIKSAIARYKSNFHIDLIERIRIKSDSSGYICKPDEEVILSVIAASYKKKRVGSNRHGMGTRLGKIYVGSMTSTAREEFVIDCSGMFTITTKNVAYNGQKTSFVWPYSKLADVSAYNDVIKINPTTNSKGPYLIGAIPDILFTGTIVDDINHSNPVKFSFPLDYSIIGNVITHLAETYND